MSYKWYNNPETEEEGKFIEETQPKGWVRGRSKKMSRMMSNNRKSGKIKTWNKDKKGLQEAWNKDKKGVSEETSKKMSDSALKRIERDGIPKTAWKPGQEPWNKDQVNVTGYYLSDRTHRSVWYRCVYYLTNKSYEMFQEQINPQNIQRDYHNHLDHIDSIYNCYLNKRNPIEVSHPNNLRIVSRKENRNKSYLSEKSCHNFYNKDIEEVMISWCDRHDIDVKWLFDKNNFEEVRIREGLQ